MQEKQRGSLTLENVATPEAEVRVFDFLAKLFGNVPPTFIGLLLKRTPTLLIDDISAFEANTIIGELQRLGATATFSPHTTAQTAGSDELKRVKKVAGKWIYTAIIVGLLLGGAFYFALSKNLVNLNFLIR